jgi:hypothetical protein
MLLNNLIAKQLEGSCVVSIAYSVEMQNQEF